MGGPSELRGPPVGAGAIANLVKASPGRQYERAPRFALDQMVMIESPVKLGPLSKETGRRLDKIAPA